MSHKLFVLSWEQAEHLRAEVRAIRERYEDWTGVAIALGISNTTLFNFIGKRSNGSPAMAMRIAAVARKSVDEVLGNPIAARWPRCGADLRAPAPEGAT